MWIPLGHASEQLKIVRQRQTPSLSARISSRSSAASSRESKMNRCALTIAAGPTYDGCAQNDGHEDVHAAQRMHFVVSSKRSRSAADCSRSRVGGMSEVWTYGWTLRNLTKNASMSTTRSLMSGRPGSGATVMTFLPSWSTRILHASRLRPLISIASEPHTPCAHDRRKVSVPSCSYFTLW